MPRRLRALGCALGYAIALALALALAGTSAALYAQSLYKYRDASGAWVYTDQPPPGGTRAETMTVTVEARAPRITVEQDVAGGELRLVAINECACEVEYALRVDSVGNVALPPAPADYGGGYHADLAPGSSQALLQAPFAGADVVGFRFSWRAVLGKPGAVHRPQQPYRVPFALGSSFRVSQAYPSRLTHTTPDSQYALDIAVPDGTPIYAAREGTVINVRHDSFRGGADAAMIDQANMVEILHDDGTIGLYAHLHWESLRVRPGQSVLRGQYIANSGNTGLSTGPHLHFAVLRNAGMRAESVPVQFTGAGGAAITPHTGQMLTAY